MKILFVCTGNTCRSCMAEAIFNSMPHLDNLEAYSCGVSIASGSVTSENSALIVKEMLNIDISKRKAVNISDSILDSASIVLTMTKGISNYLKETYSNYSSKIYSLNEYIGSSNEISDPYGCDIFVYKNTFSQLKSMIEVLITKLEEEKGI